MENTLAIADNTPAILTPDNCRLASRTDLKLAALMIKLTG